VKFNVNEITSSEKEVEVTLEFEEIKSDLESEVSKQVKKLNVPGFRKGKVPRNIVKKMYGDAFEYEASEKVANSHFWKIAKDNSLNPIGQPVMTDLDFKVGEDLKFKVKFETIPSLEVKNYTELEIEVPDYVANDDEVEKEIFNIKKSNSVNEKAEVVDGNNFIIDVEMQRINEDGTPFENTKTEKMQIDLTNERVHPDIINNANGKKVEETFQFSFDDKKKVPKPDGTEEEVSEKFVYDIKILDINKIVLPELNEELVKKVTKDKVTNESDLRVEIKKDIQSYYDQQIEQTTRGKLINKIIENNEFTPPVTLVNNILEEMIKSEEQRLNQQGIKNIKKENLVAYLKPSAEHEVKWYLLKAEIEKKENIKVSDEELNEMAKKDSEKTGLPVEKLINYYQNSNQTERLLDQKLFDYLKMNNSIKKVDPEKLHNHEHEKEELHDK
jgi:trigger factor